MSESLPFIYLSEHQLSGLGITTQDVIEAIERAIIAQADGNVWTAPKSALLPGDGRYVMSTLSVGDQPSVIVVKSVIVSPTNPDLGLPGINGSIMVMHSETGVLLAVMDANWVTAVRTAGLSAVVAKRLANPNSSSIAFVGSGVQAQSHLDAFAELFPLTQVNVFGRGKANIDKLCRYAQSKDMSATAFDDIQAAVTGADIIVSSITLSYDVAPFIDANWLKAGAFAVMTDLAIPWLSETMPCFDHIVIDDRQQERAMEKPMVDPALISGDMFDLLTGQSEFSFSAQKMSAFVFRGIAIGDLAIAGKAYEIAQAAALISES